MNRHLLAKVFSSVSQTGIILSLLLSTCIVHCSSFDNFDSDSEFWDDDDGYETFAENFAQNFAQKSLPHKESPEMQGLVCYQCTENSQDLGRMVCDVTKDEVNLGKILRENPTLAEEMVADKQFEGGVEDLLLFQKYLSAPETNPCKIITNRVLQLVESEDDNFQFSILPIFLDSKGKDSKTRYEGLKGAIETIQFQKRESSDFLAVEVQLRNKEDTFSFILPNFDLELLNIPQNSIFYTSL